MEVYEKIRLIRQIKNWSQEDMASKLEMSVNGYANIERGDTDVQLSRLKQIAKVFEMELSELIGVNEKNVLNVTGTCNTTQFNQSHISSGSMELIELKHELEKARLLIALREQENAYLKEIIKLMKQEKEWSSSRN